MTITLSTDTLEAMRDVTKGQRGDVVNLYAFTHEIGHAVHEYLLETDADYKMLVDATARAYEEQGTLEDGTSVQQGDYVTSEAVANYLAGRIGAYLSAQHDLQQALNLAEVPTTIDDSGSLSLLRDSAERAIKNTKPGTTNGVTHVTKPTILRLAAWTSGGPGGLRGSLVLHAAGF